jgi:lipopolysaccharide biosynthesis glycosyltransferase
MTMPLRVFLGYDSPHPIAYHVLAHSILSRATLPVSITPLVQSTLRAAGLYWRERHPLESTEFSLTRFLVPALCHYQGRALFLDGDMLCRTDISTLWGLMPLGAAVAVVQHDYQPIGEVKMDGKTQTRYPRKNWSSLMLFDTAHMRCQTLTLAYVNQAPALDLHQLGWADDRIGALPMAWNYLVGESQQSRQEPKLLHFTNGGPWLEGHVETAHSVLWDTELDALGGRVRV